MQAILSRRELKLQFKLYFLLPLTQVKVWYSFPHTNTLSPFLCFSTSLNSASPGMTLEGPGLSLISKETLRSWDWRTSPTTLCCFKVDHPSQGEVIDFLNMSFGFDDVGNYKEISWSLLAEAASLTSHKRFCSLFTNSMYCRAFLNVLFLISLKTQL